MAMANVDKRTQVGGGRCRSALAGVAWAEPGTAFGAVSCCLRWGLGLFSLAFFLLWGLTAVCTEASPRPWRAMPSASRSLEVPLAGLFWWVGLVVSLCWAGAEQAVRGVWWVPEDLGQGQRTPGLLEQGPAEASLGTQGCGGEGKVLGLEFELHVAGGQGVIRLAGGLQGEHWDAWECKNGQLASLGVRRPQDQAICLKGLPQALELWGTP